MPRRKKDPHVWGAVSIQPGQELDAEVPISESYCGRQVSFPVHIKRGDEAGPTVFVTAAVHGDELNGTAAIRSLIVDPQIRLTRGTLILVPVVNVLGFETHSRYLPDRRDLNRCFPGSSSGSQASRLARVVFDEIVGRSDLGIDLHTAAIRRTNHPNVRGDFRNAEVRQLAEAFGCPLLVDEPGPEGSFRRAATDAGCPTILLEAGEIWKMESPIVEVARQGIINVLSELEMLHGLLCFRKPIELIEKTQWIRSDHAGFLDFHCQLGKHVRQGDPLATITSLLGRNPVSIFAPMDSVVLGLTTLPVTTPGEPICHLGQLQPRAALLNNAIIRLTDAA
ncbi:MAG: succinylglutamate desuccinylase/aspartoacylase family protein [Planctomycetaceae bacterium]|nr:succinylglutamate desuccinylase/aspartoacylase family protein [Planctomycetaceae bacterium]